MAEESGDGKRGVGNKVCSSVDSSSEGLACAVCLLHAGHLVILRADSAWVVVLPCCRGKVNFERTQVSESLRWGRMARPVGL